MSTAIERETDVPILGEVPQLEDDLEVRVRPFGRASEAFRNIRTHVTSWGARRVACVGCVEAQGTSRVVANLALAFNEYEGSVLIVDANLRNPTQHLLFEVGNDLGLTDVLIDTPLEDALWDASDGALKLLASGPRPPDPVRLLEDERIQHVLSISDSNRVDRIIVDVPSLSQHADFVPVCLHTDGVILVADGNLSPNRVVSSLRALHRLAIPTIGVVLTNVP